MYTFRASLYTPMHVTIATLVNLYKKRKLALEPDASHPNFIGDPEIMKVQRPYSWNKGLYDEFAESILNCFPIGGFVFLVRDGITHVIDGKHRITEIMDWICNGTTLGGVLWSEVTNQKTFLDKTLSADYIDPKISYELLAQIFINNQFASVTTLGEKLHSTDGIVREALGDLISKSSIFTQIYRMGDESKARHADLELAARLLHMETLDKLNPGSPKQLIGMFTSPVIPREAFNTFRSTIGRMSSGLQGLMLDEKRSRSAIEKNLIISLYWVLRRYNIGPKTLFYFTQHVIKHLANKDDGYQFSRAWENLRGRTGLRDHIKRYNVLAAEYTRWSRTTQRKFPGEAKIVEIERLIEPERRGKKKAKRKAAVA